MREVPPSEKAQRIHLKGPAASDSIFQAGKLGGHAGKLINKEQKKGLDDSHDGRGKVVDDETFPCKTVTVDILLASKGNEE